MRIFNSIPTPTIFSQEQIALKRNQCKNNWLNHQSEDNIIVDSGKLCANHRQTMENF